MSQIPIQRGQGYPELALVVAAVVVSSGLLLAMAFIGAVHRLEQSDPRAQTLVIIGAAQILADCSLVGVWWARSAWPSHARTLVAVFCIATLWGLLVLLFRGVTFASAHSGGWAASFVTQAVLAALGTAVFEAFAGRKAAQSFSLMFLLLWMSLVAILLGAGRQLAHTLNWSAAAILGWEFFVHLQVIAIANALLALLLFAPLRLFRNWPSRILGCIVVGLAASILTPYVMKWSFTNAGAPFYEMVCLLALESLFLFAAFVPQQLAADWRESSIATPAAVP